MIFKMYANFANSVSISDFLSFKNEFNTDLKSFKNSILYNIKKLDAKFEMNYVSKNTKTIGDITTKLNLKEPIDDLNIFKEFDEQIKTDAEVAESLVIGFIYSFIH